MRVTIGMCEKHEVEFYRDTCTICDLVEALRLAIPGYIVTGELSFDVLLRMCRTYKKATGERHPADRWSGQ